jgi:hypothetical protein
VNSKHETKPQKYARRKRLALSAAVGLMLGIGCRLLPPAWQLPCAALVKVIALLFGVPAS